MILAQGLFTAVDGSLEPSSEGTDRAFAAGLPRIPFNLSDNRCIWMRQSLHARGITRLRRLPLPSRPQLVAVWESWDQEPYHAGIRIGEYFLDGEGIQSIGSELSSWEEYFCERVTL